ncbi:copper resistance system multicopper oxidase [Acinetobacter sp. B10A]|uniref:copper resistance system multicopper oxidase n=1 Tax=Acinetobacter baretiae TaxID=2605383 RepID=UPI001B3C5FA2|nr:copper resistance system multicopper oxidase [Acinetobacter baretiae]MBF7686015.1 copper resistance system multicopper oxidase [Acinetobacter baretiae]
MSNQWIRYSIILLCVCFTPLIQAQVREYHLSISEKSVNITGKTVKKIVVNEQLPAPTLTFEEGDEAVIYVHNALKNQPTSLHWHGLLLPNVMDGVPGLGGFKGIAPQGDFVYRFKVRQSGTYWYHAHSKGQEQDGVYGAFIVYPKPNQIAAETEKVQQDHVILLSDFHTQSSQRIMDNLKKSADFYQNQRQTLFDVVQQLKNEGLSKTWQDRKMWAQMRMLNTDLSDVTGYTFLMNGFTPTQPWTNIFKSGEKIRLRFINASAMSFFDVRIPHLKLTVVSADGQAVKPVTVDEFRFGAGETYDVIVEPTQDHYQIQAESIDRSGFALGELKRQGVSAIAWKIPQHRPRALLSMSDMGMQHDMSMNHDMPHDMPMNHEGMQHGMPMNHEMPHDMPMNHEGMQHDMPMNHEGMPHDMPMNHDGMQHDMPMNHDATQLGLDHQTVSSKKTVEGWGNASTPRGEKMLQYSDLQSLIPQKDTRPASQEIVMVLGGNMERYIWTINGKKYSQATPLKVHYGERVKLTFVNESMMAHPMHLHGMFVQLDNGQSPEYMPSKHTVIVPPGKTVSVLLTADELGDWALHCHLLYHMNAGMMNTLTVAKVGENSTIDDTRIENQRNTAPQMPNQGASHVHH